MAYRKLSLLLSFVSPLIGKYSACAVDRRILLEASGEHPKLGQRKSYSYLNKTAENRFQNSQSSLKYLNRISTAGVLAK